MQLTVKERLQLLAVLPREGSVTNLRIVRKLRESLSFSEAEHKQYGIEEKDGIAGWRGDVPQESEIEVSPGGLAVIEKALKDIEAKGTEIPEDFLPLWDRFLPGEKKE